VEETDGGWAVYTDDDGERELRKRFAVSSESFAEGWEEAWREFHHGVVVGGLWVGPPWELPTDGAIPVVVDPGRAFGTGAHATTRLSLELLQQLEPASLLDVGCGSGVVAISAVKLGFGPAVAIDVEDDAVQTTIANARVNGVEVTAYRADALAEELPEAEVAVANIAFEVVQRLLPRLRTRLAIVSGYLDRDAPDVAGWRRVEHRDREGWGADLLERELS
jgi:ribosomal protein L11 methyltransferase